MAKIILLNCLVLLLFVEFSFSSNIYRNDFEPIYNVGDENVTSFVQPRDAEVTSQDDHTYPNIIENLMDDFQPIDYFGDGNGTSFMQPKDGHAYLDENRNSRQSGPLSISFLSNCYVGYHTFYDGNDIITTSDGTYWCYYAFSNPESKNIDITCKTEKKGYCNWWWMFLSFHAFWINGIRYVERETETFQITTNRQNILFSYLHSTSCFTLDCVFSPPDETPTTTEGTPTTKDCECGKVNRKSRIVNGVETEENEYPFQVLLSISKNGDTYMCGGSIIYNQWILTAAHCTSEAASPDDVKVYVAAHDRSALSDPKEVVAVYNHEDYDADLFINDISLLKLKTPLTFSDTVSPICLPKSSSENYDDLTPTVIGWGTTSFGGSTSNVLLETDVPVVPNSECINQYPNLQPSNVCAGDKDGKDACQGDSGGPLFTDKLESPCVSQIGIVSYGRKCAEPGYPGVYARVSYFLDWISDKTGQ